MLQIVQNFRSGSMEIIEAPLPICDASGALVAMDSTVISIGTEKMLIDFSKQSLIGKAKKRPDLVRKVMKKARNDGLIPTIKTAFNKLDTPIPLGYSGAGTVIKVGEDIHDLSVGDTVAIAGAGYANHAEVNFVPRNLIVKIPSGVELEDAAFTTIASIALQGIRQANPSMGENVGVIGLGLIGQITCKLLEANGCNVVAYDPDNLKAKHAKQHTGAWASDQDFSTNASIISHGHGLDSVIITASCPNNQPLIDAGEAVKVKGTVVMVGFVPIEIPRDIYYGKELEFKMAMSYGPGRYDPSYEEGGIDYPYSYVRWTENRNMQTIVAMLAQGKLDFKDLKTERFSIEQAKEAYNHIEAQKGPCFGIVLRYKPEVKSSINKSKYTSKSKKTDIGLIGCGNFAQAVLIPEIQKIDSARITGVVAKRGFTASQAQQKYKIQETFSNTADLINSESVSAVVITTRHNTHAQLVIDALENNKDVFVEKPLCLNLEELERVSESIKTSTSILQVGFNRRFSPLVKKLKNKLHSTAPMIIHYNINAGIIPKDSWLFDPDQGGGRIVGEVCHFVDLISHITDSEVTHVHSFSTNSMGAYQARDNIAINLKLKNGHIASIHYHAMGNSQLPKEDMTIFQNDQTFNLNNFRTLTCYDKKIDKYSPMKQEKGFKEEIHAFINSLSSRTPAISFDSIKNTTLTTFLIEQSLRENKVCTVTNEWTGNESIN